jgi:hypothetical protein
LVGILYFTVFAKKQWILLLLASVAFYLFSGPKYIVFVTVTAFTTPHHGHEPYQTFVDYIESQYLIVTNPLLNTRLVVWGANWQDISNADVQKHAANDALEQKIGAQNVYSWKNGTNIFEFTGAGVNISRAGKYTFTTSK